MKSTPASPRRRAAVALLVVAVLLVHGWLATLWSAARLGEGAADRMPRRIEVAYVRELAQAAPPPVAPVVVRKPAKRAAPAPPAASAPAAEPPPPRPAPPAPPTPAEVALAEARALDFPVVPAEPTPAERAASAALAAAAAASAAEAAASQAVAAAPAASAASAPVAFQWPPSTRLTYRLTGNYRGEVVGAAMVEWVRAGSRYQVHLDVFIGPQSAPVVGRRMTSDGELTDDGLVPRRYDEETRALFRQVRRRTIEFEAGRVLLPNGKIGERLPQIQDSASQFVQLSWLFTTQPELLQIGRTVEVPLALPTKVDRWSYDVVGKDTLKTPIGPVEAFHMKPRREARPGGDLVVDVWFAPSLQYLPVRLLIRQDENSYVDLLLDQAPEQAER